MGFDFPRAQKPSSSIGATKAGLGYGPEGLELSFKHGYTGEDILHALRSRVGEAYDYPRPGRYTVVGLDMKLNPVVVIINTENETVFHAFGYEKKHGWMLRSQR